MSGRALQPGGQLPQSYASTMRNGKIAETVIRWLRISGSGQPY
jgi:hypothetical protein